MLRFLTKNRRTTMPKNQAVEQTECICGLNCLEGECGQAAGEVTQAMDLAFSTIDSNILAKQKVRQTAQRLTRKK